MSTLDRLAECAAYAQQHADATAVEVEGKRQEIMALMSRVSALRAEQMALEGREMTWNLVASAFLRDMGECVMAQARGEEPPGVDLRVVGVAVQDRYDRIAERERQRSSGERGCLLPD